MRTTLLPTDCPIAEGDILEWKGTGPVSDPGRRHLQAVAVVFGDDAVIVPICSFEPRNEDRYRIRPSELREGLLKHDSVFLFADTKFTTLSNLARQIGERRAVRVDKCSVDLLERVQGGLRDQAKTFPKGVHRALVAAGIVKSEAPRRPTV